MDCEKKYCCPIQTSKKGLGKIIKQDESLILEWLLGNWKENGNEQGSKIFRTNNA